jgi:hypothetical protein
MPHLLIKTLKSLNQMGLQTTVVRILKYPFKRLIARKNEKRIFKHSNIEDKFTEIYKLNYWTNQESASGGGSTLASTENLRKKLPELFTKFSIQSVFDAPCGDFNWMRYVVKDYPINYIGGDIVLPLIDSNNEKFKNSTTKFIHIDLTTQPFPISTLMICRDCLFHLSYEDTKAVLKNFINSEIDYLLTTTYINLSNFSNRDIETGYFRQIDLFSPPYNFPKNVLFRISDWDEPDPEREMCLWSRRQLVTAFMNFN